MPGSHVWALVLAGGSGRRLQPLTRTASGGTVPKQFCSLGGGPSLLHLAMLRARHVAPAERILVTLAATHRTWWKDIYQWLPRANVLVEPEQRGTGIGILHPLLEILQRDPDAVLAILPSDHYVRDESAIAASLEKAVRLMGVQADRVMLLGLQPEDADPDLGYIVPAEACGEGWFAVRGFSEKPGADRVAALLQRGALCNSFIVVTRAATLLELFERQVAAAVARLRDYRHAMRAPGADDAELARLFAAIPTIDFSSQVIADAPERLSVLRVAPCGWSDLGTPPRVERVLRRHGDDIQRSPPASPAMRGQLDLAERTLSGTPPLESKTSSLRS
jgi:mannose-1-phosphate guanylyltransferase